MVCISKQKGIRLNKCEKPINRNYGQTKALIWSGTTLKVIFFTRADLLKLDLPKEIENRHCLPKLSTV